MLVGILPSSTTTVTPSPAALKRTACISGVSRYKNELTLENSPNSRAASWESRPRPAFQALVLWEPPASLTLCPNTPRWAVRPQGKDQVRHPCTPWCPSQGRSTSPLRGHRLHRRNGGRTYKRHAALETPAEPERYNVCKRPIRTVMATAVTLLGVPTRLLCAQRARERLPGRRPVSPVSGRGTVTMLYRLGSQPLVHRRTSDRA